MLHLAVRDTGIGISAKTLARIGLPFEQANNDPMRAREGTGLGLALVKALAHRHGGRVHIESREAWARRYWSNFHWFAVSAMPPDVVYSPHNQYCPQGAQAAQVGGALVNSQKDREADA